MGDQGSRVYILPKNPYLSSVVGSISPKYLYFLRGKVSIKNQPFSIFLWLDWLDRCSAWARSPALCTPVWSTIQVRHSDIMIYITHHTVLYFKHFKLNSLLLREKK